MSQEIGLEEMVFTMEVPCAPDAPGGGPKGWKLRNEVLFEQSHRQKNYVTVEQGGRRRGLTFDAQHPLLPLSAPSAP
jgi:hypothetical protein